MKVLTYFLCTVTITMFVSACSEPFGRIADDGEVYGTLQAAFPKSNIVPVLSHPSLFLEINNGNTSLVEFELAKENVSPAPNKIQSVRLINECDGVIRKDLLISVESKHGKLKSVCITDDYNTSLYLFESGEIRSIAFQNATASEHQHLSADDISKDFLVWRG